MIRVLQGLIEREAKKGFGDEVPKRVLGTGACRRQWRKQAGGTSEIARNAKRDYASFPERGPNVHLKKT